jgi:hypothetical protein
MSAYTQLEKSAVSQTVPRTGVCSAASFQPSTSLVLSLQCCYCCVSTGV